MKIYYCEHFEEELKDGTKICGPYIYKFGVGKPHYCIRVNRGGYLFVLKESDVPKYFLTDSNIKVVGDTDKQEDTAVKTVLSNDLGLPSDKLLETNETDLWRTLLSNKEIGMGFKMIEDKINAGKRVYSAILNERL